MSNDDRDAPILVVDDDPKIVRLIRTYLERDGLSVVSAVDGPSALAAIERFEPALVVLDLMLPELDGRAVLRAVRRDAALGRIPILVVSARGATLDRIGGLEDGADDYLPKPFSPAELVLRVKAILRRSRDMDIVRPRPPADGRSVTPAILVHRDLRLDMDRHEVSVAGTPVFLTAAEFRLLAALLRADGRVLTRERLIEQVYDGDAATDVLDRTIDVHIGRLREKLGDEADRPRYVATVRGVGYRAAAPDASA